MRHVFNFISALIYLLVLTISMPIAAESTAKTNIKPKTTFVIGKVSQNPDKHYYYLKPMADYLASHLKDFGIKKGKVLMARDDEQMIRFLKEGKVDLVTESSFSAMRYTLNADVTPIAIKWKKGVSDYSSIIFVRKDSDIYSLKGLLGKTIAFEDEGSSTASMLPMATLLKKGYPLFSHTSYKKTTPANMIGYINSGSEKKTSRLVYGKKVAAGAISNLDWNKPDHIPGTHKQSYRIIHNSIAIPRAVEVINNQLNPKIISTVKKLLLKTHEDPKAILVLDKYQKTKRFEAISPTTKTVLEEIKELVVFLHP